MNNFRKLTLGKIAENSEILTEFVTKTLKIKPEQTFSVTGSVGPGTTVMTPPSPVKPDGSVDFIINIRGIAGGDIQTATKTGANAVIITAEAGGLGSKENAQSYGNANFINQSISKVLDDLQKKYPDKKIKRGKLTISGFSGGGSAIANIIAQRNQVEGGIDGIILNDALHTSKNDPRLKEIIGFAQEAMRNPSKKFKLVHTAVEPGSYSSTTEVADYILSQLNLTRKPVTPENNTLTPVSKAKEGGVEVIQLYSEKQPYMVKDPATGELRPNIPGSMGWQHIQSLNWGLENLFKD